MIRVRKRVIYLLSQEPIDLSKVSQFQIDCEIMRLGMIAELDAVSTYEQLAAKALDAGLKRVLLDIAKEEKTHIAEFEALLLKHDAEQAAEMAKGQAEVEKLIK